MTVLETPRLLLRHIVPGDLDALSEAFCDAENMRYFPNVYSRKELAERIQRVLGRYRNDGIAKWAVILKSTGELLGDCGLMVQEVDGEREIEVGYVFARRHHGNGYATEAARASMDYGFERLDLSRIISLIRPENVPSRRVAERNGLTVWKETMFVGFPHLVYAKERGR